MFEVGDYVVYGNVGVCEVIKIGGIDMAGMPKDRQYYTLSPQYEKGSTVFTPVDNTRIPIRLVMTGEEAANLVEHLTEVDALWVPNEKKREEIYKKALRSCDYNQWAQILKTLYIRNESRVAAGKKITAGDKKYLHAAEEQLYGELAIALDMERMEVGDYVEKKVREKVECSSIQ